jgi:hypothetical protein
MTLDPRLAVSPIQGLLETSGNATTIAYALASSLNELPVQLILHNPATCSFNSTSCTEENFPYSTAVDLYIFETAKGSNITVELIQGRFIELQYDDANYSSLYNDYWNSHPYGSPPSAAEDVAVGDLLLKSFGLDLSGVSLADNVTGPGWASWTEEYNGLGIANSGEIYFEVYPPTSQIIRLVIDESGGWHLIPSDFPLNISASAALDYAKAYATNTLHMGFLGYASVSLEIVQNCMYYAATVSNQSQTYVLFVNPITGEVGFPQ